MARGQSNTNGVTPLADTVGGAAGTLTGTERATLQSATAAATANAVVKRDASGNLVGNLAAGSTDGDKLHGVGSYLSAVLAPGSSVAAGPNNLITLTLGVGTWLVFGNTSMNINGTLEIWDGAFGSRYATASLGIGPSFGSASTPPIILGSGATVGLRFSSVGSGSTAGTGGISTQILAIRIA